MSTEVARSSSSTAANASVDLERQRDTTLQHDVGAGAPCLKCGDDCPGLELHFWRCVFMIFPRFSSNFPAKSACNVTADATSMTLGRFTISIRDTFVLVCHIFIDFCQILIKTAFSRPSIRSHCQRAALDKRRGAIASTHAGRKCRRWSEFGRLGLL